MRRSGDVATTTTLDERFTTVLAQAMLARKLDRDWTLLGRDYLLKTDYSDRGDIVQNRAQLGVAYRDTDTNRVNALGKIEWKDERDGQQRGGRHAADQRHHRHDPCRLAPPRGRGG